jgi:hypothetical protein
VRVTAARQNLECGPKPPPTKSPDVSSALHKDQVVTAFVLASHDTHFVVVAGRLGCDFDPMTLPQVQCHQTSEVVVSLISLGVVGNLEHILVLVKLECHAVLWLEFDVKL